MKQLFLASTLLEVATLAAGIDSGAFDTGVEPAVVRDTTEPAPRETPTERILLLSDHAMVLEQATPLADVPGMETLIKRFDRTVHLNQVLTPNHPNAWRPSPNDIPLWERLLREHWELGEENIELILESPQVNPAISLSRVFSSAAIRIYADGLMTYGPTRNKIPLTMLQRVTSLHYVPLAPDVTPLLLREAEVVPLEIPPAALAAVIEDMAEATSEAVDPVIHDIGTTDSTAFVIGQFTASLGLLTTEEETALHCEMIRRAGAAGCSTVVFKPHPSAPESFLHPLEEAALKASVRLVTVRSPLLAEIFISRLRPRLVISAFSTTLPLAKALFGVETLSLGAQHILSHLTPYANPNRIPLVLTLLEDMPDISLPHQEIVEAVSYCMQPEILAELRPTVTRTIERLSQSTAENHLALFIPPKVRYSLGLPAQRNPREQLKSRAANTADLVGAYTLYRLRRIRNKQRTAAQFKASQ